MQLNKTVALDRKKMWATFYSIESVGRKGKEWLQAWSLPTLWSLILLGYMLLAIKRLQVSRMLLFPITDRPPRSRESLFHSVWETRPLASWSSEIEHRRKRKTISCHKQSFYFNLWSNFIFYFDLILFKFMSLKIQDDKSPDGLVAS